MTNCDPHMERHGHVEFAGWYLTHAVWRNSYGSYQSETGVRFRQPDGSYADFTLAQHNSDNWHLVTVVMLAGLSKGWAVHRTASLIDWLHRRMRRRAKIRVS